MPNYIDLTSPPAGKSGSATLDNASINVSASAGGSTAVEVTFQTLANATGLQSIFSIVQYATVMGDTIPVGLFSLFVEDGQVGVQCSTFKFPQGFTTATAKWSPVDNTGSPITVNDGDWHSLAVNLYGGNVALYVDGFTAVSNNQIQMQPLALNAGIGGPITLGSVNIQAVFKGQTLFTFNSSFVGRITEVRVWNVAATFTPAPFSPVGPDAAGLTNYWPFWTNYKNGTRSGVNQEVATAAATPAATATLTNCQFGYAATPIFYDPWSEAVMNSAPLAFPALNTGSQTSAVQDVFSQLVAMNAIQHGDATLPAFRQLYQNKVKLTTGTLAAALGKVTPSQSDADYKQAFQCVVDQLTSEVNTADAVWQYQAAAMTFITTYQQQITTALTNLQNNLGVTYKTGSGGTIPITQYTSPVPASLDAAMDVAKSLLELVFVLVAAKRKKRAAASRTSAVGEDSKEEKAASAVLQLIFALMRFATAPGQTTYAPSNAMNTAFTNLSTTVNQDYTAYIGTLSGNTTQILQDWGKLQTLFLNSDAFDFPYTTPSQAVLNAILTAHELSFSRSILTSIFSCWTMGICSGNQPSDTEQWNSDILQPNFYEFDPYKWGYMFHGICNFDTRSATFTSAPSPQTNNWIQTLGVTNSQIVWGWGFAQYTYNPSPSPDAATPVARAVPAGAV